MTSSTPAKPPRFSERSAEPPSETSPNRPFVVNIVTGKGGGGHYATYRALRSHAEQNQLPWQFQVTDMDDIMAEMTQTDGSVNIYRWLGSSVSDLYNRMLSRGWTWLWPLQMQINKLLVKLNFSFAVSYFERYWEQQQPDIVVSVVTMCNQVLCQALHAVNPRTPYATVMIDFADMPPGFWIEPGCESYIICGTQKAATQASQLGVLPERIVQTSGMVIHPQFQPDQSANELDRTAYGLHPDKLTGLVMFGGNGSDTMLTIANKLEKLGDRIQLIFLCGRSQSLYQQLTEKAQKLDGTQQYRVLSSTSEVPKYMQLADFFIGKPGPGSLSEAIAMNLPVITERNVSTLIHERYNATWIEENNMGIVLPRFAQVASAVEQFLDADTFCRYQRAVSAHHNHAVTEVCALIETLLAQSQTAKPQAAVTSERALKATEPLVVSASRHYDSAEVGS